MTSLAGFHVITNNQCTFNMHCLNLFPSQSCNTRNNNYTIHNGKILIWKSFAIQSIISWDLVLNKKIGHNDTGTLNYDTCT